MQTLPDPPVADPRSARSRATPGERPRSGDVVMATGNNGAPRARAPAMVRDETRDDARDMAPAVTAGMAAGATVSHTARDETDWASLTLHIQLETVSHSRFRALAMGWLHALARNLGAEHVALAWRHRRDLSLAAAAPSRPSQLSVKRRRALLLAMDEACDQQVTLSSVNPAGAAHIVLAQNALARRFQARQVLVVTVPLAREHATVGALCLIWTGAEAERMQALLAPLVQMLEQHSRTMTPLLELARVAEQPLPRRLHHRLRHSSRERRRRLAIAAALGLLAIAALLTPFERHLNMDARLQGAIERQVAAPDDGTLARVNVRPGDRVTAGTVLATLTDRDLRLERDRLVSELAHHQGQADAAMAERDRAALALAQSLIAQTQSQLARHEARLSEAQVRAPIDGVVLDGELWQSAGTPVSRGQTLFTLAPEHAFRVVVDIDEADRGRVTRGMQGQLDLQGIDGGALPITLERIAPVAVERDASIIFEAHATLRAEHADLQAGMSGIAQIRSGSASLLGRWTEGIRRQLQLLWWRWRP